MPTLKSIRRNDASQSGVVWDYQAGQLVPLMSGDSLVAVWTPASIVASPL